MEEEGGYVLILEVAEQVYQEEDTTTVLEMSLVEVKIKILISHVGKKFINKKDNVFVVGNMSILHMNAGINIMRRASKVKTSTFQQAQCYPIDCNVVQ